MRVLYGVQATGQGHISRARAMAEALRRYPVKISWLFSGRPQERLFDMECFGEYIYRQGLSFATDSGSLSYLRTLRESQFVRFITDIKSLELDAYDLVITDYEPVTAWAAKFRGIPAIGMGHQYAFGEGTPRAGGNPVTNLILKYFAPVDTHIGFHWFPYNKNVLPPIIDLPAISTSSTGSYVVYLPFEDQARVTALLKTFPERDFIQFAPGLANRSEQNVTLHPTSIHDFKRALAQSRGVICNSGFELISECLQWGKSVLTKPLTGQPEQLSNALSLSQLGVAEVVTRLDDPKIGQWLSRTPGQIPHHYPDVAAALARWIAGGCAEKPADLSRRLWGYSHSRSTTLRGYTVSGSRIAA